MSDLPFDAKTKTLSFTAKAVISCLLVVHLLAAFSAPWGSPPPASLLAQRMGLWFRPYTQSLAIDNGYRYFAPDPEANHLVRYTLTSADGTTTAGEFPDRQAHRPRLLYHRHLMLAEAVSQLIMAAPDLPADLMMSEEERAQYEWQRTRARLLLQSLGDQLLEANPHARSVELVLHEHSIPTPTQVVNGLQLTDESLYDQGVKLGIFQRESP